MDSSSLTTLLESAEVQAFATGFPTTLAHLGVTLALLAAGATLYALFTPWREISLIREGNAAAAVAFSGVLLGLAIPLAVSLSVSTSIKDIVLWGVTAAAVLLVGAKLATALILAAALTG